MIPSDDKRDNGVNEAESEVEPAVEFPDIESASSERNGSAETVGGRLPKEANQGEATNEGRQLPSGPSSSGKYKVLDTLGQGAFGTVFLGYPTAYEDAAHRAVKAGLDLLEQVPRFAAPLNREHGIDVTLCLGVHTGLAVLHDAEDGEGFSITGDARNVAHRLLPLVEENTLVITESTQRIVRGFFECESLGKFKIKGIAKEIELFRVTGEGQARSRIDVAEMVVMTPLVGRDTELAVLIEVWEQVTEGWGQIVCVLGEAGLGKSRLVREIRDHVTAGSSVGQQCVMEWRCSPFYGNTGFYPAIDYFERLLNFRRESSPGQRLEGLEEHLQLFEMGDPETVSLLAAMLAVPTDGLLAPLQLSPIRQREMTQQALLRYVGQVARRHPLLFVVEDLHWIDATTLEWLGQLLDQGPREQLLTLLTFRPEFETPWGSRGHQTQIALNRLTKRQIAEMVLQNIYVGEEAPQFHVAWGMWAWRLLRSELDRAAQLADDVWALAEAQNNPGYLMEACFARECTALFRGEFGKCLEFSQRGFELYDTERCRFHAAITGQNAGCTIPAHWAWGAWIAGFSDQALSIGQRGVSLGRELKDPFSYAFAIYHLGCVYQHCRRGERAIKCGEKSIAIGKEQGFGIWIALGTLCLGSGLVLQGKRIEEGVELVKKGFESFRGSGAELSLTHYYAVLAEAYRAAGRTDEARESAERGLESINHSNERFHEANLCRLRGELLLAEAAANGAEAERDFQVAIEIARKQAAKSWELRGAISMAKLWVANGRRDDAHKLLSEVYESFTEGFETPDLQEAKAMLQDSSGH